MLGSGTRDVEWRSGLATAGAGVSASTQNQALAALLFHYDRRLASKLPELETARAKRPVRLPTVMSRNEVQALLAKLHGKMRLMASLLYGSGCAAGVRDAAREGCGLLDAAAARPPGALQAGMATCARR